MSFYKLSGGVPRRGDDDTAPTAALAAKASQIRQTIVYNPGERKKTLQSATGYFISPSHSGAGAPTTDVIKKIDKVLSIKGGEIATV